MKAEIVSMVSTLHIIDTMRALRLLGVSVKGKKQRHVKGPPRKCCQLRFDKFYIGSAEAFGCLYRKIDLGHPHPIFRCCFRSVV